jgi:ferrous iron transport protein B
MHCHGSSGIEVQTNNGAIALVGHPNVGKSIFFQKMTGQRTQVSNYPGTTVELSRGLFPSFPDSTLVDTPGVITFPPQTEDEFVTANVLLDEPLRAVIQVGDAKNLRRTLLLTIQLAEMGLPMIVALNMMDEAHSRGVYIDIGRLAEMLSLPIIPTVATRGEGLAEVSKRLHNCGPSSFQVSYPDEIENAVRAMIPHLPAHLPISARSLSLLFLSEDAVSTGWLEQNLPPDDFNSVMDARSKFHRKDDPAPALIQNTRIEVVNELADAVLTVSDDRRSKMSLRLGQLTTHPFWGFILLGLVLYSMYWFVGIFGAGTLVGLMEENLFGQILNPWFAQLIQGAIPFSILRDLLVGEYGLWTMGMTYAIALILPIVSTFFLAFGVLEDSGYLPRLAALSNRFFAFLGLNGKAVLPMVLGLGCVTMATVTTRTLESKRERWLVTLLLALAIPCSAQLGVVMGMLAGISFTATLIWSGIVFLVLLVVGWLAARLLSGERTQLLVELPPLRWPQLSNVVLKTLTRLEWYIEEVVPLFLLGTLMLFVLDKTGVLNQVIRLGEPLVSGWLGLPAETSAAFLIGFLRRDFAATNLFVMQNQGLLTPLQVVVAMVTITLFIPCIASVMMIAKERGWRTAAGMVLFIFPLAFLVGGLLYRGLSWIGWGIG